MSNKNLRKFKKSDYEDDYDDYDDYRSKEERTRTRQVERSMRAKSVDHLAHDDARGSRHANVRLHK
jgi:hypothetical protein